LAQGVAARGVRPEREWIFNRPEAALLFVEQDTEKFGLPGMGFEPQDWEFDKARPQSLNFADLSNNLAQN
jgi:hypothetical protein